MSVRRPLHTLLFLPLALLAACRDEKVTAYRVPKEKEAPPAVTASSSPGATPPAGGTIAGTPVSTAEGPRLTWTAPEHWKPKRASAMRKGSYAVPGEGGANADLSITAFPGDVGGELANVNRWRGQIQLPPLAEADLVGAVMRVEQNGLHFGVVEFTGGPAANPQRILGAIVPVDGATWFIKLMGPDALVAKEKPAFTEFLKTVKAP